MKKVLMVIALLASFALCSAQGSDQKEMLSLALNKNVEVHYSVGGSTSGYRIEGKVTKVFNSGIVVVSKDSRTAGTHLLNFDYIVKVVIPEKAE